LYLCKQFDNLSVYERRDVVTKNHLCFKCLNGNLQARACKFLNCSRCGKRHNIKLHLEESNESTMSDQDNAPGTTEQPLYDGEGLAQAIHASGDSVMLATAIVLINDISGVHKRCRALLDSGSQINFITDACVQSLKLSRTNCHLPIVGINSRRSMAQKLKPVIMSSWFENFSTLIDLHILPSISNTLPAQPLKLDHFKIPEIVKGQLADPSCGDPGDIQLLLGAEVFYTPFSGEKFEIYNNLMFYNTVLGWVLTGKVSNNQFNHIKTCMQTCFNERRVEPALSLFVTKSNGRRTDEQKAEKHFNDTHYWDDSRRFVVRLPLITDIGTLGDSSFMAQRRFLNLERRLSRDKGLGIAYHKFMSEYLNMNHMELVTAPDPNKCAYYLPHHAVVKESSIIIKLRVVFDGFAPSSFGLSLNNILYRGPKVQPDY
jgi:ribosomal protein S27AE